MILEAACEFEDTHIPLNPGSFLSGSHQEVEFILWDFRRTMKQAMNQNNWNSVQVDSNILWCCHGLQGEKLDFYSEIVAGHQKALTPDKVSKSRCGWMGQALLLQFQEEFIECQALEALGWATLPLPSKVQRLQGLGHRAFWQLGMLQKAAEVRFFQLYLPWLSLCTSDSRGCHSSGAIYLSSLKD